MILVDTSVWVDHLRSQSEGLTDLLSNGEVLIHPFVVSELALGQLRQRDTLLRMLTALPGTVVASEREVLVFIEGQVLFGRGIGYVDVHLLAATRLTLGAMLWTSDRKLQGVAAELGLAATPPFRRRPGSTILE